MTVVTLIHTPEGVLKQQRAPLQPVLEKIDLPNEDEILINHEVDFKKLERRKRFLDEDQREEFTEVQTQILLNFYRRLKKQKVRLNRSPTYNGYGKSWSAMVDTPNGRKRWMTDYNTGKWETCRGNY